MAAAPCVSTPMHVLIADDNLPNLRLLRALLEAEGHEVTSAADGMEALELVDKVEVQAIISDILMPRMDGYRFCMEVRKRDKSKSIPFIIYTSTYNTDADEKLARDVGADKFIQKPAPASAILASLAEFSSRSRSLEPLEAPPELDVMKLYSERLVAKLEERNLELKHHSEALEASEARLRDLFENAHDLIIVMEPTGKPLYFNRSWQQTLGYDHVELQEHSIFDLMQGSCLEACKESFRSVAEGRHIQLVEIELRAKDGRIITVEGNCNARFKQRECISIRGIFRDITERKRAEAALRERKQQLRLFVEHSPAAIAMFDGEMHYLLASRRWLSDYHLDGIEIIGRSHYEIFPNLPERWKVIHQRCLAGAIEKCEEDSFYRPDGALEWVRWEVHPWYNAQRNIGGIIIFSEVITEQKHAEHELRCLSARLLQLQDEERRRIARELHDQTAQQLTAIGLNLSSLERLVPDFRPKLINAFTRPWR